MIGEDYVSEVFDENKEEFQKGLEMGFSWGIEAYYIDKETDKLKTLTLEEALELKDNPNYEVVSIQDYSPEEVMKQFAEHLTSEEVEYLTKIAQYCGTMIQSTRLCNSYEE